jgi:TRAP-type C4-dicarboxylate transport system permease large subunit
VGSLELSPIVLILALTVVYIILGTALDGISLIVLTTPVVIPLVTQAGYDLIWFGIFMVMIIEMAEISPPVGFNLFVLQNMTGRSNAFVSMAALPFFIMLVAAIVIITLLPSIVTILPTLVFQR